ncbi:hypothetical protein [Bacillus cereus]|uniref:Uncharacterized protein n=1 Tax=Bacillus cereus 03BB108 TaxID=451709 RepID=A0AAN0SYA0_BACCE|nr:hypothetical protein [Bacillus cereus]AJI12232.1 hypothetical protein AK40_3056 [Bacillus cereus 03BB108]EDX63108.1 conserved hypothetical protein [Bacillus cereus 03BB108]QKH00584.1 hypothetical protein FOC96_10310 [Bacillus cereus]
MKTVKKGYRLTYYIENEKQPEFYDTEEKNFYRAEVEFLKKLSEVEKLDFKKKDKITLTNNKTEDVYHAVWNKFSPVVDRKNKFYLEKFTYKSSSKKNKNKMDLTNILTIIGIEFLLLCLMASMIGVCLSMFIPHIFNGGFIPYLEGLFLLFLLIVQFIKEFIYEYINGVMKKEIYIDINIIFFELSIAFGTFSTLYSFIYKQNPGIVSYNLAFMIYFGVILLIGIFVVKRMQKESRELKNRDRFHNRVQ